MAEDPEKRFHSIMEKLFHAPPPKPISVPSSSSSRGKKRANPESVLALVEPGARGETLVSSPPLCRPWDRGDLIRRLATFKSMTWFAKPKVVSAVNCARRGWINVDMDMIACESCGARLLFSTLASWTQQQVEKAALVFSLKLDSGHKLHCPWIDNTCDERLTEFPPTPPPVLVDKFRERSAGLLQLLALPLVSSSAIDYVRTPQLEAFLKDFPMTENEDSFPVSFENQCEADSAKLYHQAQKLISLCGWEPRSLPYAVESKDRGKQHVKDLDVLNISGIDTDTQDLSFNVHAARTDNSDEANKDFSYFSRLHADPNSVVLDCRLCGASVGLWTFALVQRPLELFRLVGFTELNNKGNFRVDSGKETHAADGGNVENSTLNGELPSADRQSNLSLTIAGGPLPTKQNFKAIISIPVIGWNLRAKLSYDSDFRDCTFNNKQDAHSDSGTMSLFVQERDQREQHVAEGYHPDGVRVVRTGTHNHDHDNHVKTGDPSSRLSTEYGKNDAVERVNPEMSSGGVDVTMSQELAEMGVHDGCGMEHHVQSEKNTFQGLARSDGLPGDAQGVDSSDSAVGDLKLMSTHDHSDEQQFPGEDTFCRKDNPKSHWKQGETCPDIPNNLNATRKSKEVLLKIPTHNGVVSCDRGEDLEHLSTDNAMEFDPIRQHRHFCPWIASTGSGFPGWQQTLIALQRNKEHFDSSFFESPAASVIEVDNPIASVRRLFRSSSAKKIKSAHGWS